MSKIRDIKAREILDSRGNPTIEVELTTDSGVFIDSVPSGASTGKREAIELRDNDSRFGGKGVERAVYNVENTIKEAVKGMTVNSQNDVDTVMIDLDGTEKKSKLGANAIMAVSLAVARAKAKDEKQELFQRIKDISGRELKMPCPCFNVLNGGKHAGNDLAFQEFMIAFEGFPFKEQLRRASEMYHKLKEIIEEKYGKNAVNVGDEGGFAPPISKPEEALDLIVETAKELGFIEDLGIFLDVAASSFFDKAKNRYLVDSKELDRGELIEYYQKLCSRYPIKSIEDPLDEDDFEGFKIFNQTMNGNLMIVGDDLTTTNIKYIEKAYDLNSINALLLKINQIGTVSEAIEAVNLIKTYNWKVMVSHRSGETTDDFIADFAVGVGADYIKSGAPARGERVVKYNRLLKIEELLNENR
jgi:enolase